MNSNNLDTMEKNLRSIAKRYENVKYSIGLAVLFLMKGTSAFSEDNHIQEAERKKDILTDDQGAKSVVKKRKAVTEANKKIKASWANMQFGANDMYSNYFSIPKAKVDKASIVKSSIIFTMCNRVSSTTKCCGSWSRNGYWSRSISCVIDRFNGNDWWPRYSSSYGTYS